MNSRFLNIAITLIIVLGLAGGAFYLYTSWEKITGLKVSENEEEATTTEEEIDKMADWKVFKSSLYGYEVKYPSDWFNFQEAWGGMNILSPKQNGSLIFAIAVDKGGETQTNEDILDQMIKDNTLKGSQELKSKKEISVNGVRGFELIWNKFNPKTKRLEQDPPFYYFFAPEDNKARFIIFSSSVKTADEFEVYEGMVSTFRFPE